MCEAVMKSSEVPWSGMVYLRKAESRYDGLDL